MYISCYHYHYWNLTVSRLTGVPFRLTAVSQHLWKGSPIVDCQKSRKQSQVNLEKYLPTKRVTSFCSPQTPIFPLVLLTISSRFTKYDPFYQTPMGLPSVQVLESFRWARATWVYVSSCITQKSMPLSLERQMVFSLRFLWLPCFGGSLVDPLKLAFKFVFEFGFADVSGLWKGEGFWGLKV